MASSTSSHAKLVRSLYRGLMRSARRIDAGAKKTGPAIGTSNGSASPILEQLIGSVTLPAGVPRFSAATSAAAIVKHNFRAHAKYAPASEDTKELVDLAFAGLKAVNARLAAAATLAPAATSAAPASFPIKPATVNFSVGHVIRHRSYGYRGVIVGWHDTCRAAKDWASRNGVFSLPHGTDQPFYLVLCDVRDRPDAQVSYVAQDNIQLMSGGAMLPGAGAGGDQSLTDPSSRLVLHPLVPTHFSSFLPGPGVYVPGEALAKAFPADSPMAGLATLRSQSDRLSLELEGRAGAVAGAAGRLAPLSALSLNGSSSSGNSGRGDDAGDRSPRASRAIKGRN